MKTLSHYVLILMFALGCASKPVLYPNEKYKSVGKEQAQKDINQCLNDADEFLESSKGKQILKSAGKGSIVGAVMGGITGVLTGDIVEGLATGAALGGAGAATGEAITPDRLKQSYTNTCLGKRGYRVLGWD